MKQNEIKTFNGPLAGIRVADFGHVWAGPYCAATLSDLGAEVIKIESSHRLDIHRRQGPYQGGQPEINRSGVWNAQNRGKRSVTLNLQTDEGRELARQLVDVSDVLIENYSPGVMKRLKLAYDNVSISNPRIVYASLSAFGQTGPQRDVVGYGPSIDAWSGLDSLICYEDGIPGSLGGIFPDTGSALFAAVAIISSLIEREVTSVGRFIDLSELEVTALLIGEAVFDGSFYGLEAIKAKNTSDTMAIVRSSDGIWFYIGDPNFTPKAIHAILRPNFECRFDDVDPKSFLNSWAAARSANEVQSTCHAFDIPVAKVNDIAAVLNDPHLSARRFFKHSNNPNSLGLPIYGPIMRFSKTPSTIRDDAPVLGEANQYVFCELLGMTTNEVDELIEKHIIE